MIEDVEYKNYSKAAARVFDKIDNGKYGVLPSSIFDDLIEIIWEVFHSEYLTGHIRKVYPN